MNAAMIKNVMTMISEFITTDEGRARMQTMLNKGNFIGAENHFVYCHSQMSEIGIRAQKWTETTNEDYMVSVNWWAS